MAEGIKTRRGESKGINLNLLYDAGYENARTGGWQEGWRVGSPVFTKGATYLSVSGTNILNSGAWSTQTAIDLTNYTALKFIVTTTGLSTSPFIKLIATTSTQHDAPVGDNIGTSGNTANIIYATNATDVELSIDISSVNSSNYFQIAAYLAGTGTGTVTIKKVWLE